MNNNNKKKQTGIGRKDQVRINRRERGRKMGKVEQTEKQL
jgi:hypothetical protein